MDKKTILAIIISIGIFAGWTFISKLIYPPLPEEAVVESSQEAAPADSISTELPMEGDSVSRGSGSGGGIFDSFSSLLPGGSSNGGKSVIASGEVALEVDEAVEGAKTVTVDTPLYRAVFSSAGGGATKFELKKYKQTLEADSPLIDMSRPVKGIYPLQTVIKAEGIPTLVHFTPSRDAITVAAGESAKLDLTWRSPDGVTIVKSYTFNADDYTINGEVKVLNASEKIIRGDIINLLTAVYDIEYARFHSGPVTYQVDKAERLKRDDGPASASGTVKWLGLEDKFFLLALMPGEGEVRGFRQEFIKARYDDGTIKNVRSTLISPLTLNPNAQSTYTYKAFIGPKVYDLLNKEANDFEKAIEFGFFDFMAKPTLVILNFFQRYVGNYGLAIVILTILIKIAFHPLTKKSLASMKQMSNLQPQMKAIKEKLKGDKTAQNKEIMALYKRHNVNPLNGCMPMVLQIPVFIALYEVLAVAIELRHAPFIFWLVDLSEKDPYYITPLLMGGSMFLQQKLTPTTMDAMQSKMMLMMPIVFTFIFLSFPSGLVLYWLTNNILTVAQHWHVHKSH